MVRSVRLSTPLVSVGIPTRNRRDYVIRAIKSVLAQTYTNLEIVVADNASADDTLSAVRAIPDPRIRVIAHSKNIGMIGNFNASLDDARGTYFLMLSDDDFLAPGAISALIGAFEDPPQDRRSGDIGIAWTPSTVVDSHGVMRWVSLAGPMLEGGLEFIEASFRDGRGPRFCGVMVRAADAREVGGYQERHGPSCDVGNWSQIALRYPYVVCTQRSLAFYTIHRASETNASLGTTWQGSGENIRADLVKMLSIQGRIEQIPRMKAAGNALIGDLLIAVLSQSVGRRGWVRYAIREVLGARKYLLTKHVARRFFRDAWKLAKLRS